MGAPEGARARVGAPRGLTAGVALVGAAFASGLASPASVLAEPPSWCGPLPRTAAERAAAPAMSCPRGPTRALVGEAPGGWASQPFDDARWTAVSGQVAPRTPASSSAEPDDPPPPSSTVVDVPPGASLFLRRRFDLAADANGRLLETPRVIELRARYLDGLVAYLNGSEVARRNLSESNPAARPALPHGHEEERIFLPVTASTPLRARDNVIAIEVRPALGRRGTDSGAPSASIDVTVVSGVRVVRGPYLVAPVAGSVSVAWETDLPTTGTVELQPDQGEAAARAAPVLRTRAKRAALRQVVRLDGLRAGASYRYRVIVDDPSTGAPAGAWATTSWASFSAQPAAAAPLRFVVYGDMRAPGHAAHAEVVAGIVKERPALVLCTGDLVAVGSEESAWQKYFEITAPLGAIAPVVPAFGNHETYWHGTGVAKAWGLFGLAAAGSAPGYASFEWGGAHFVVLDTNHVDAAQRDWLARDLDGAKKKGTRAIFAVCHDGPWSHGVHGSSGVTQRELAPVLAAAGVDVLFSGHDHLYERGTGTTPRGALPYMVVGGGGAPLYEPSCRVPGAPAPGVPTTVAPPATAPGPNAPTLPVCPPSVANIVKAHHYVVVEVNGQTLRLCAKRPDGSPLEPCVESRLRQGREKSR